jgi:glycosyltransferase involved in cell wall biosynthesis
VTRSRLIVISKSHWDPPLRREHALSRAAVADGLTVHFLERPLDVRAVASRGGRSSWNRALRSMTTPVAPRLFVHPTAVPLPPHRSDIAERFACVALSRRVRQLARAGDVVVVCTPWHWRALDALPRSVRRVFDCADDWSALVPQRRRAFRARFEQIAVGADAVVLASPEMTKLFPGGRVTVVPNGVDAQLLAAPASTMRDTRRLVYVGTLSPRFDAALVAEVMQRLPAWRLDLYGQCQYPGHGERPAPELAALLHHSEGRIAWHGVVQRPLLHTVLDRAAVAILPNRIGMAEGQDAMKLYDYAARGMPIVSTQWSARLGRHGPPGVRLADDGRTFAEAVLQAAEEPLAGRAARRMWAGGRTWEHRWTAWAEAALGRGTSAAS